MSSITEPLPVDPFRATAEGVRHQVYRALAERGPIQRITGPAGRNAWFVTGYAEARALLSDARVVKTGAGRGAFHRQLPPEIARSIHTHLLSVNPPDHTRLRRLVSGAFTRRQVERLEPHVRRITDELLAPLGADDVVDLVPAFAYPLPVRVICALLGIPPSAEDELQGRTRSLMAPALSGYDAYLADARALVAFVGEQVEEKRRHPGDDLLSALIAARDGSDRLSEDELIGMVYLLFVAGHETTVNLVGNGVLALLTHPDQLALLRAEPDRADAAVEELLRFDGPVQTTMTAEAAERIEIGGVTIGAGELVYVILMAANRDPGRFPEPERLDIGRETAGHLAFGHGIHHCLGAPLARLEGRIALGTLVARYPRIALARPAAELVRTESVLVNGLESLPVRLGRPRG
ncbi:hypothetical protein BJF78_17355 [Pseudonocardia sp. CNS-139]|nr:hypothetical protein BJF78_17355 [Pseudonocardia sp. CNS-139]